MEKDIESETREGEEDGRQSGRERARGAGVGGMEGELGEMC